MRNLSKTDKLLVLLSKGKNVPLSVLRKRTGLANLSSTIDRLRGQGYAIYFNERKSTNNHWVKNYRLDLTRSFA